MSAYSQASDAVFEVFHDTTPVVEPLSVDEAFLDVSGLRRVSGTPVEIATRLRAQVRDRVGLPITVGIAAPSPGQGGQPGGETRRAAAGAAGPGVGIPASVTGATAVGCWRQDRGEAARTRHRDSR